jgi:hypothetical protein
MKYPEIGHGPARIVDTSALSEAERYEVYRRVAERFGIFDAAPHFINLIGVRGYRDGKPAENAPNRYNDTLAVVRRDPAQRCSELRASVDPGDRYTRDPLHPAGCANLSPGQYRYKLGLHKGRPALVQAGPVRVWRDSNENYSRERGEREESGYFGLNIHDGGSGEHVGGWSAGCQVVHGGADGAAWQELLRLARKHPGPTILYTLIECAELADLRDVRSYGTRTPL